MNAQSTWKTFPSFALRVIIAHSLTYFIFGAIMSNVFDYAEVFKQPVIRDFMLPVAAHNILWGPFMQPLRGLVFAIGLWPIRGLLIERKRGWLILWGLLLTIGIISTPSASPGSIEGVLYSKLPLWYHLMGLPEITLQTLVFSVWLVWWERQSAKGREPAAQPEKPVVAEIVKAIMAACFAYIGYAVGGLLLAAAANARAGTGGGEPVDFAAASTNFKMQFMFVVAFVINAITVFWIGRRWQADRIPFWGVFLLFWFLDAIVPWLYQTVLLGGSFIPTAILLGLFPAAIIAVTIRLNYRRLVRA